MVIVINITSSIPNPRKTAVDRGPVVETNYRDRRIETVRAELLELHMECIALARKLESTIPSSQEKLSIAHQWEDAMKQSFALQSHLEDLMASTYATVH
jgi:hypothetical protein